MTSQQRLGGKRMKKQIKWLIVFGLVCVTTLILTMTNSSKTLEELVANEEDFFLVIGASTCSYCQQYKRETLSYYSESEMGMPLVEVDWLELTEDEQNELLETYDLEIEVTPTTYYFKAGRLEETKEGVLTLDDLQAMKE